MFQVVDLLLCGLSFRHCGVRLGGGLGSSSSSSSSLLLRGGSGGSGSVGLLLSGGSGGLGSSVSGSGRLRPSVLELIDLGLLGLDLLLELLDVFACCADSCFCFLTVMFLLGAFSVGWRRRCQTHAGQRNDRYRFLKSPHFSSLQSMTKLARGWPNGRPDARLRCETDQVRGNSPGHRTP